MNYVRFTDIKFVICVSLLIRGHGMRNESDIRGGKLNKFNRMHGVGNCGAGVERKVQVPSRRCYGGQ